MKQSVHPIGTPTVLCRTLPRVEKAGISKATRNFQLYRIHQASNFYRLAFFLVNGEIEEARLIHYRAKRQHTAECVLGVLNGPRHVEPNEQTCPAGGRKERVRLT